MRDFYSQLEKVDKKEVYTYSQTTGGLTQRVEYRGRQSNEQRADIDN